MNRLGHLALAIALSLAACVDAAPSSKPDADPDAATLSEGKADLVSNVWTTIAGTLTVDSSLKDTIDHPDWFRGYTMALEGGETLEFTVTATEEGWVRLYGPAHRFVDGEPRFKRALVKSYANWNGSLYEARFEVSVNEPGTYMLLYGPRFVWQATYKMSATCTSGCLPKDACLDDAACGDDAYCGHNGVVCITAPCDASYDVCKPKQAVGGWCDRDAMCAAPGTCDLETSTCVAASGCATNDDCSDGFCGCVDASCSSRTCKPWQAEGESCGGYTLPHLYTQCDPALSCASPNWIADLPGICAVSTSLEALYATPELFAGRTVAVAGHVLTGYAMCTKMYCSEANPCCNSCSAQQRLYAAESFPNKEQGLVLLDDEGRSYGCSGDSCDYGSNCTTEDGEVLVIGTFEVGTYDLELDVQTLWTKPW